MKALDRLAWCAESHITREYRTVTFGESDAKTIRAHIEALEAWRLSLSEQVAAVTGWCASANQRADNAEARVRELEGGARNGYRHTVHELLTNIKRTCIRGRNCAQTDNNLIATCDHIENMADEALGYLAPRAAIDSAMQGEEVRGG